MDDYAFYADYNRLINALANNSTIKAQTWYVLDSECVELRYAEKEECVVESDYISEITAAFTTANARVRLYRLLDWLHPSQLAYCDTDSVIFMCDEANPEHRNPFGGASRPPEGVEFGDGLGQWKDELKGDHIVAFAAGGAKSKAFITNNPKSKKHREITQKGITLNMSNDERITVEGMIDVDVSGRVLESAPKDQFKWDNLTKEVRTHSQARIIRSTIGEKRTRVGHDTLPFGYRDARGFILKHV